MQKQGATKWAMLAVFIAVSEAAGMVGSWLGGATRGQWYDSLAKPPFNPPSWVFAPVWITLYALMGIAAWLAWLSPAPARKPALAFFAVQLVFNAAWTWIFFGLHQPGWALVEIVVLWLLIVVTLVLLARCGTLPALLWVPYVLWVSFALVLNASIWHLNR